VHFFSSGPVLLFVPKQLCAQFFPLIISPTLFPGDIAIIVRSHCLPLFFPLFFFLATLDFVKILVSSFEGFTTCGAIVRINFDFKPFPPPLQPLPFYTPHLR